MLLAAANLRSGYATGDVIQDVGLTLTAGEVVGVLGRNGVGKSTLMKTLIGLLPTRGGEIRWQDRPVTALPAERRARLGIGYVPQGREIFPSLSVLDNLRMGGFARADAKPLDFDLAYACFPFLKERGRQRGGTLSGGQQEMLAIARALVGGPELLLLDEPSDGVQPSIVQEIGRVIAELNRAKGLSVLIVEQNIELMQAVAHRAYILDKGRVVAELDRAALGDAERIAGYLAL